MPDIIFTLPESRLNLAPFGTGPVHIAELAGPRIRRGARFIERPRLSIRPGIAAVGRVTFSSGESSFKSLVFIGGEVVTEGRKAEADGGMVYD